MLITDLDVLGPRPKVALCLAVPAKHGYPSFGGLQSLSVKRCVQVLLLQAAQQEAKQQMAKMRWKLAIDVILRDYQHRTAKAKSCWKLAILAALKDNQKRKSKAKSRWRIAILAAIKEHQRCKVRDLQQLNRV